MARSPVTDLLEQFKTLNEVEQNVFLDLVAPEPEPEAPKVKRTRKKRAEAPATQKRGLPASNGALCVATLPHSGRRCGGSEDDVLHDSELQYADSHPFQSSAPVAAKRSSRKSASTSSTPSTANEAESGSAVGASAGGD